MQIFFRVIFPVLRSVIMTVIILQSVFIYNDFPEPAVLPPGNPKCDSAADPVQLQEPVHHAIQPAIRQHLARTIPALIMFIFFNRKIVEGMAAGSVKG